MHIGREDCVESKRQYGEMSSDTQEQGLQAPPLQWRAVQMSRKDPMKHPSHHVRVNLSIFQVKYIALATFSCIKVAAAAIRYGVKNR